MPPFTSRDFALNVVKTLQQAGYQALWAGGCVRDQLMGLEPSDYDVATNALPNQIRDIFGKRRTLSIGASFGVITVLGPTSAGQIEVATFRSDGVYSDGRHPDTVTFSDALEDARRRDFTINGLFFNPTDEQVIDYVEGRRDIERRLVRAIGDPRQRFAEDKLRMLRAVRFAATFDFDIEANTLQAIQQRNREIHVVSKERIGAELRKILTLSRRASAFRWLHTSRLFSQLIPTPEPQDSENQPEPDVLARCEAALQRLPEEIDHCATLACLLWFYIDDGAHCKSICRNFKWSNKEVEKTVWVFTHFPQLIDADRVLWSRVQPLLVAPWSLDALSVGEAIESVGARRFQGIEFCRNKLQLDHSELDPPPLLVGEDLIALQLPLGPAFGKILEKIRQAQLDDQIGTKDEALELARQMIGEI